MHIPSLIYVFTLPNPPAPRPWRICWVVQSLDCTFFLSLGPGSWVLRCIGICDAWDDLVQSLATETPPGPWGQKAGSIHSLTPV